MAGRRPGENGVRGRAMNTNWAVLAVAGGGVGDVLREEFTELPDAGNSVRVVLRLLVAVALGGLLGWERQRDRKPAGLRTHMLVTLGSALFVLVPQMAHMDDAALSRVIQGLLAGIGFIGGGS